MTIRKVSSRIKDILREAYFTYEYKSISELLVEMRQASFNIAIVLDEYGETSGLITLEDILKRLLARSTMNMMRMKKKISKR